MARRVSMTISQRSLFNRRTAYACAALIAALLGVEGAEAGSRLGSAAAKCEAKKLKITAIYGSCQLKAQSKAVKTGDIVELSAALAKCEARFTKKWSAAEKRGGLACPTTGDADRLQTWTGNYSNFVSLTLRSERFVDNGNGTITDARTGLMWEKKEALDSEMDFSNPHDADNTYTWSATGTAPDGTAFTQFLGALNDCVSPFGNDGFAGYCDWRLPTLAELQSIFEPSPQEPCPIFPPGCIDPIFIPNNVPPGGSNFDTPFYWTSISFNPPTRAHGWGFDFISCTCLKSHLNWVRAVRGGFGPGFLP